MIESLITSIIIFINYDIVLNIIKQTSLITININKINLRLMRAFDYLQRFEFIIRYKFGKQHVVLNVLSRLKNNYTNFTAFEVDELNVLIVYFNYASIIIYCFIIYLIEISTNFK